MKLSWDIKELVNFGRRVSSSYEVETTLMTITQRIAKVLHQNIIKNTPIDTGNLRKMWSAGDNLLFTVTPVSGGYEVVFINEARANSVDGFMYGVAVNDGHTSVNGGWVVGRFFVETSILEVSTGSKLEQVIMRELEKWWKIA